MALQEALNSLRLVQESIENKMPEDFYSIDTSSSEMTCCKSHLFKRTIAFFS